MSSNVHPNDSGDQISLCEMGSERGSPGTSRPRTKEMEGGREQKEDWKGHKKKNRQTTF